MRILVAAERLGQGGGMERYLELLLPQIAARGATVHAVARRIDAAPPNVAAARINWAEEHDPPSAAARSAMERTIAALKPDVAVVHNVMDAGIVEALRAIPRLVYHPHDHRPFCPNGDRVFPRTGRICTERLGSPCTVHSLTDGCVYGPRRRTARLIRIRERLRDAIVAADAVIVTSRYMATRAAENGVSERRIVEIVPPLPDEAYADSNAPTGASGEVVFAGRVVPQKGLDSLIRAVATIAPERRPRVRAFGDGPELPTVRALARQLEVSLEAPGNTEPATIRGALDDGALLALPSRWAEPFGYVGIEALARSRPVVAYDVGGVSSWLADGWNGIAVGAGDEASLGASIAALLGDEQRRARLGRNGRSDAERYRMAPLVDALLSAYEGR